MTDPTSLSTPPLQSDEGESSKSNSPTQSPEAMNLSDIPVFNTVKTTQPCVEPSSCETTPTTGVPDVTLGYYEYEFSCSVDGRCSFIHLVDSDDVSACERVTHRPLKHEDISYSGTGNGFIVDCYGLKMTFTKQPYVKSWETYADIKAGVEYEKRSKKQQTAADILAGL
jgi:hypothetical protein